MGLALPLLTLLLLGVIDLGRAAYFSIEVQNAAEAAAIYGTHNPADTTGMEAVAVADAANVPGGITVATPVTGCMCSDGKTGKSPGCTVQPTRCPTSTSAVNYVTITTSYNYTPMFAWPGIPSSITLTGSSTMRY
jgi:Flp pilus assembly protein TadG